MANYNTQGSTPLGMVAGATVAQYRLVKGGASIGLAIPTTAITEVPIGASMQGAATGETFPIQQRGRAKLTAAAAITLFAEVSANSADGGKIIASSGSTAVSIGVAMEAAGADGDIIEVDLFITARGPANT